MTTATLTLTRPDLRTEELRAAYERIERLEADLLEARLVVGKNFGKPLSEANDLDWMAIDSLKQCLERHGYKVIKPRQKKVAQ